MNRWHLREWKIVGLYALLYFFCVGLGVLVGTLFDRAGNMYYAPAFAALFGGTVYMLLQSKVQKFGAISFLGIMMGCFFFTAGHFFISFLPGLLFGLVADFIAKAGNYRSRKLSFLSFIVFSFVNSGPIIMMWLARSTYIASLVARGRSSAYIERVMVPANAQTISWFVLTILLGAILGALIGQFVVQAHLSKKFS